MWLTGRKRAQASGQEKSRWPLKEPLPSPLPTAEPLSCTPKNTALLPLVSGPMYLSSASASSSCWPIWTHSRASIGKEANCCSFPGLLRSLRRASGSDTGSNRPVRSVGTSSRNFLSILDIKPLSNTLTQGGSPLLLPESCSWQMYPRCSRMVPSSWSWTFRSVEIKNIFGGRRFLICSWDPDILCLALYVAGSQRN